MRRFSPLVLLIRFIGHLPQGLRHGAGRTLGWLFWLIPNVYKRVTLINLGICLPELDENQRRRLARRSLIETGITAVDAFHFWFVEHDALLAGISGRDGEEMVRQAIDEKRGVIIAAPHLGSWELLSLYLGATFPSTNLYRPPRNTAMRIVAETTRGSTGAKLVPTNEKGVRELMRALKAGEMIGIPPDMEPKYRKGEFAPFFGYPALTQTMLSKLAIRHRPLVVVAWAEREADGRHRIHYLPVDERIYGPDLVTSITALNETVERAIRLCPEQFQWNYKRFRKPPKEPGYRSPYK